MATTNRKTERGTLKTLIETAMVGAGLPLQAVYGYQTVAFAKAKQLATMVLASAGTQGDVRHAGNAGVTFYFYLHAFVLYEKGAGWTETQSEDRIDDIEYALRALLKANTTSTKKYALEGRTQIGSLVLSGEEYRREVLTVSVWLANG